MRPARYRPYPRGDIEHGNLRLRERFAADGCEVADPALERALYLMSQPKKRTLTDVALTVEIVAAGQLLDIALLDHLIRTTIAKLEIDQPAYPAFKAWR